MKTNKEYRDLGLYIHIPFCVKKCNYCDFLSAPASQESVSRYFESMLSEIEQYRNHSEGYIVPTIFIGGGTPSVVEAGYISLIMKKIKEIFRVDEKRLEATIEINPGTVTGEKLRLYHETGINRISFGLQSANDHELSLLGRIHKYAEFEENYYLARKLGFRNISVDLMSALPGQTLASWENTLEKVIKLSPEHISAYSLIIEEGTEFFDRYKEGASDYPNLPDEETDRLIYHRTKEILQRNGYQRYEISNYAKPGYECHHNSSYWIGTDYLGIGLGSSSLVEGARFSNISDLNHYIELCRTNTTLYESKQDERHNEANLLVDNIGLRINQDKLTMQQKQEEFMFLGLRMCEGVSKNSFTQRFGTDIDSVYGEVMKQLVQDQLLDIKQDQIRLTDYGIDISNYVLSKFLLDSI